MPDILNIVFSAHRVEFLTCIRNLMQQSDIIILEEAPSDSFREMLGGKISISKYLEDEIFEFPEFTARFCEILRELSKEGIEILQIEPYMERLLMIYDLFSLGKTPLDVENIPQLKEVYDAERKATKALIDFYEASLSSTFSDVVESVKIFARADAHRFRLRDELRAEAVLKQLPLKGRVFIESGAIHQYFGKILSQRLANRCRINKVFCLEDKVRQLTGKSWIFPPGDILTLRYIYGKKENPLVENLLIARSLIYIMLIEKREMFPTSQESTPHLVDEINVIKMVNKLSFKECEMLYREIRFKDKEKAREIIKIFLLSKQRSIRPW